VGAGLSADLAPWFPAVPVAAMAILGMVSYFAGVVQAPITAFVIMMEITGSHSMALPLMAAAFIAYGASRLVSREPIYRTLARRFMEPDPSMPLQPQPPESSRTP
jgi:H+/Cl- antiporter ClcA